MVILALIAGFFLFSTVVTVSACMVSSQFGRQAYAEREEYVPVGVAAGLRGDPAITTS
jgi:hypothetical protein